MPTYRKKPVDVEMIRWTGENLDDVRAFMRPLHATLSAVPPSDSGLTFHVVKGQSTCTIHPGDWVVRERDGSGYYPLSAEDFADGYEPEPIG